MKHISIIFILTTILLMPSCKPGDNYIAISGYAQGGTYTVKLNLSGKNGQIKEKPYTIKKNIDSLLTIIDTTLSGYNKGSQLSRFNNHDTIVPNAMFKDIYSISYKIWQETKGAVDIAAGPLYDLWGFGFTKDSIPSEDRIAIIIQSCGMKKLKPTIEEALSPDSSLNPLNLLKPVYKPQEDIPVPPVLNFNAIAQGYSCDVIAEYLYSIGVKDMLVDIGEIYCDGLNPSGKAWNIAVDNPIDGNDTPGKDIKGTIRSIPGYCGIVTSGNYRKFHIKDGKKYAHTIDPRTGYPVFHNLLSATILARNATIADAYATYCMVIGVEKSINFIENNSEIEGYLIYDENGSAKTWSSQGLILNQ
ncbi:MAG: FAD:protein FMN transferase [Candidatus Cryptobacteroides sp.]